ncbi:cell division site-positioning protein MapZ family protein [Vagococcus entomophilus]|uniref:MapZ extracellular domain-containing protein n=1 Tax=Vagococcus entomophilus TaxID=1160095 RepID=A0A430AIN0_9ENTE|nr:cell division site-positioning protein MapZ family protein [Vagococcus entomophilus]RSU07863.1 hypothetical protein CBF30_01080 [Vagococcus entomophilus]
MSKKNLVLLFSIIFALLTTSIGWIGFNQKVKKNEVVDTHRSLDFNKKLEQLFTSRKHLFLAENVKKESIRTLQKEMKHTSDLNQKKLVVTAAKKLNLQNRLNQLFDVPIVVGEKLNSQAKIKNNVNENNVAQLKNELLNSESQDEWNKLLLKALDVAFSQVTKKKPDTATIEVAQSAVAAIVQNDSVVQGFTMDEYLKAKNAVALLSDGEEKKSLQEKIKIVQKAMDSMGVSYEK